LKLDLLLTQYLYQKKRISLPGIGTFSMDGTAVKFDNKSDSSVSPDLIEFVKTHTGKMNSLALSDIESFIMLNTQFLNIGKALYFEGIGTLAKTKDGSLEFNPGDSVAEKLDDLSAESRKSSSFVDDNRYTPSPAVSGRGWLLGIATVLTLALIVWGGWKLFLSNSIEPEAVPQQQATTIDSSATVTPEIATVAVDTGLAGRLHSETNAQSTSENSQWRFIIEQTANKNRAYKRFNQLKEIGKNVQLDNQDTLKYKLYFLLPALPADTARIKDSLKRFYSSRRVIIEQ
jgi:hypothetical protein